MTLPIPPSDAALLAACHTPHRSARLPACRPLTALSALGLAACLCSAPLARAVYAPIPEQEQGKPLVFSVRTSAGYDSNVFGAARGAVDTPVYTVAPKAAFNASLTKQTFASAYYGLTLDHMSDRPGDRTLDSHELFGRIAHSFSEVTTLDLFNFYQNAKNPESLLAGVPLNTDQSFQRNQLDFRFTTAPTQKSAVTAKYRHTLFDYRNAMLGRNLDRTENLAGLAAHYDVLPETKAVAEYRRQQIDYWKSGANKDKESDFVLTGVDYRAAEKLTASVRLGVEWRHRDSEKGITAPSAECTLKYDYAPQSFLSAGYAYALEETSNVELYNDSKVNRLFANLQHAVTAKIVASASLSYEPGVLQGRRGIANVDETAVRCGAGLSYLPGRNWTLSATYDYDRIRSDDRNREMTRHRTGASVSYAF